MYTKYYYKGKLIVEVKADEHWNYEVEYFKGKMEGKKTYHSDWFSAERKAICFAYNNTDAEKITDFEIERGC